MNNKLKMGIITTLCIFALSCGNGQNGKVLFESADKKIKVYENEVDIELQKNLFSNGLTQKDLTPDQIKQMKQSIIKNIALNRALAIKGKEEKLDKDKKYTENQNVIKEQLLASLTLVNEVNGKVNVTDEEAKKYYDANPAAFTLQEDTAKLQIIAFKATDSATASQVLKDVLANPNNFTTYARKYNANIPGVPENGETSEIPESRLGALGEAIKNVAVGQIVNNVVKVDNALYIVKVLEKNSKGLVPFEKVKEGIKAQRKNQKRQVEQQNYLKSVSDEFKLSNMDDSIKNIK